MGGLKCCIFFTVQSNPHFVTTVLSYTIQKKNESYVFCDAQSESAIKNGSSHYNFKINPIPAPSERGGISSLVSLDAFL